MDAASARPELHAADVADFRPGHADDEVAEDVAAVGDSV